MQHILLRIQLAHHIARAAPTCKVVSVAVRAKFSARSGVTPRVNGVAAVDGRIITGSNETVKVWRDGVCVRTLGTGHAVALLPGSAVTARASGDRRPAALVARWAPQDVIVDGVVVSATLRDRGGTLEAAGLRAGRRLMRLVGDAR